MTRPHVRCAIYARKSSEAGLDQSFKSLEAQREACCTYILSQKHEGWTPLASCYGDGGFSGGTIDGASRPAAASERCAGGQARYRGGLQVGSPHTVPH
jgi:site-specific DNA recombinase